MTHLGLLDEPLSLDNHVRQSFDDEGFVKIKGVLDQDVIRALEPEITEKVIELNTIHLPMEQRSTYDKAFLQVGQLRFQSAAARAFVFSKRLARVAAELLGVRGVRLYSDQALYKEGGGGITPWHADQYYWPFASDRACTVWIPLQETPLEIGPLSFAVGSHRFSFGRDLGISDESESALQGAVEAQNFEVVEEPYEVGEVSYHLGWTFHRASPNRTSIPRRVMTVIYMDVDMVVAEPSNTSQANDLRFEMPGAVPGAVPDTPYNPELYAR
ncbi:MAG: Ectoine hydroxylase-related dioxygenase, phytanoyl-CoA dioxygenase (PhyH) family [Acidimicrobiaceae bacterium]|nr:Ectoine hydroxylase-related dioxygenase, phytanoyl-CoA dioxygenase (PhyH) family [Acidimicrobiaceae bacterium]